MNFPSLAIFFANSALYFFIGHSLSRKRFADPQDARAWRAFRVWWYGMAANTGINGLSVLALGLGIDYLPLFVLFSLAATLSAAPALWGLLTYLMYIFKGSHRFSGWIAGFYIAFGVGLLASIYLLRPIGVSMGTWEALIQYQNEPQGVFGLLFGIALIALMSLPPIVASIGMFSLYFRITEPSAKFRALLVPLGLFTIFGLGYFIPLIFIVAFGINPNATTWWPLTIRLIGIAALALIYIAYFPPAVIQKRFHVQNVLS
ncbi:MAG: hypothetical protein KIS88_05840 [Anaerolineales bacterium]|nr:hypothetical protein [Anaerolineales bacterium]